MKKRIYKVATFCFSALFLLNNLASAAEITDLSLAELRQALDSGQITSKQLVQAYLNNIEQNDKQGKRVNAIITLNPDALKHAEAFDNNFDKNHKYSPLAGIPFLVKDNINTEGITTTGGTLALKDSIPNKNAFVVQKLVDSGAIVLGKTNLSELAASYGRLGYSSVGGQTVNPFNDKRDASGSSSGSAVSVAMRFAPFALGSDTSASIRAPASTTATVGLRPSMGLIGRTGVIPLSLTADTVGVITRTVEDQAIVLDVINAVDPDDAATFDTYHRPDFTDNLKFASLKNKKIAVIDNFDGGNDEVDKIRDKAVKQMINAGAIITRTSLPPIFNDLWSPILGPVGLAEFSPQMNSYLKHLPQNGTTPSNMTEFIKTTITATKNGAYLINPGRFTGLMESYNTDTTDSPEYIRILTRKIPELRNMFDTFMSESNYDAVFFTTMRCPPSVIYDKQDPTYKCSIPDPYTPSYIASALGLPEISVPAGSDQHNLPIGVSFLGKYGEDSEILNLAHAFEKIQH